MEEHLHKFFGGSGIGSAAEIEDLQPRPQPLLEMAVFRVFQEALTNILRHSDASFVRVALTRRDGLLHLQIVDDGRGFDVAAAFARDNGLGLSTMRERAQQAHGELTLHSVAGFGTELTATFAEQEI
jgi:signal transduction histidine kinase